VDSYAGYRKNRVGDSGRDRGQRRLAQARWRIIGLPEGHLDLWGRLLHANLPFTAASPDWLCGAPKQLLSSANNMHKQNSNERRLTLILLMAPGY